jgi:membrane protein YqaA with SNARE-associated domain
MIEIPVPERGFWGYLSMSYLILFVWSFLAATVIPVGSEPMLIGLIRADERTILIVAVATVGNFLGACTLWWMGRRAGALATTRLSGMRGGARAADLLRRYGKPALALAWVPLLGDILIGLAGAAGISFKAFAAWTVAGKAMRYGAVAWIALQF